MAWMAWLGGLLTALFAQVQAVWLAYQKGRDARQIEDLTDEMGDVDAAVAAKRRVDGADKPAVELMRNWYADAFRRDKLPRA